MIVPSSSNSNSTLVRAGMTIYRGFSDQQEYSRAKTSGFTPKAPMSQMVGWFATFDQTHTVRHVLTAKRDHFVSFSLQPTAACFYATSGYKREGWIAEVALPQRLEGHGAQGQMAAYMASDKSSRWVDPRHLAPQFRFVRSFPEWPNMWNRSIQDDELLLAAGRAKPIRILRVRPNDCDRTRVPWVEREVTVL